MARCSRLVDKFKVLFNTRCNRAGAGAYFDKNKQTL